MAQTAKTVRISPQKPFSMLDYKAQFESSCQTMKESIIYALVEVCKMTQNGIYVLDKENTIRLDKAYVIGAGIIQSHICLIINKKPTLDKKAEYVVIREDQTNKVFMQFNSKLDNWISLIHCIQKEAGLIDNETEENNEPSGDNDRETDDTP